jgi:flagellar basal-body rod protein FlgF
MRQSLLISARAMDLNMDAIEVNSNNLANLDTVGFKRDRIYHTSFRDLVATKLNKVDQYTLPSNINVATDFSTGGFRFTQDKMNAAISGDGFFKVQLGDGEVAYTKRGVFNLNPDRQLMIDSYPVLDVNGESIFLENNNINIDENGIIYNEDNDYVAQLDLVTFQDKNFLQKIGGALFGRQNNMPELSSEAIIKHRYLEESNVSQINSMTEMISIMESLKYFELHQKFVQMQDELSGKVVAQAGSV